MKYVQIWDEESQVMKDWKRKLDKAYAKIDYIIKKFNLKLSDLE